MSEDDNAIQRLIRERKMRILLSELFPQLENDQECPHLGTPLELTDTDSCAMPCYETETETLANTIIHLNDDHGMDRDSIADWIETLGDCTMRPLGMGD